MAGGQVGGGQAVGALAAHPATSHGVVSIVVGGWSVVPDHHAVAGDADEGVALDDAVGDVAAGDRADLRDLEDLADLGVTDDLQLVLRLEQPLGRELAVRWQSEHPDDARALFRRAEAESLLGAPMSAVRHTREYYREAPRDPQAHELLETCQRQAQRAMDELGFSGD